MAEDEVLSNQKTILDNQAAILENQKTLLDNQEIIKNNQKTLDEIINNQHKMLALLEK